MTEDPPRTPECLVLFVWSQVHEEDELWEVICLEDNKLLHPLLSAPISRTQAVTEANIGENDTRACAASATGSFQVQDE